MDPFGFVGCDRGCLAGDIGVAEAGTSECPFPNRRICRVLQHPRLPTPSMQYRPVLRLSEVSRHTWDD